MSLLDALVLGLVQGLTEFLPVSSSGHLVLAQSIMGLELPGVLFEVTVHVATLVAICWVYRERLWRLARGVVTGDRPAIRYALLLALGSLPAAAVGIGLAERITPIFEKPVAAAAFLLVTGGLVWTIRFYAPRAARSRPRPGDALSIGVAQAVAILPGISRSGATVAVGTAVGVEPARAAEFSFLLSIPAIAGAALLQLSEPGAGAGLGIAPLALSFAAAAVSGVVAIRIFLGMLERRTFHRFAYYCWTVGAAYLIAAAAWPALR